MLSTTLNFSRAAVLRNQTQPTFSRRIQQLELWLGAALVDRTVFPVALTREGAEFRRAAEELVQALYRERDLARGVARPKRAFIAFAMVQTIATSFFPRWLSHVEGSLGSFRTSVQGGSIYDCFEALASQSCDIVFSYNATAGAVLPDDRSYTSIKIAEEHLIPVCAPKADHTPRYSLDTAGDQPIPYLGFSNHAYLARLVESILQMQSDLPSLDLCYESALAAGLKAMAVAGRGVAWLPYFAVKEEFEAGQLVAAGGGRWTLPLEIRAYRSSDGGGREPVQRLWADMARSEPLRCLPPVAYDRSIAEGRTRSARQIRLKGKRHRPTRTG
ncbi:LysR substrate-binding domain-containing protein [Methylobacterium sp. J-070]|nr:LysR substrate-binding domain-containing protein [Methylobacterium sp. J-070]